MFIWSGYNSPGHPWASECSANRRRIVVNANASPSRIGAIKVVRSTHSAECAQRTGHAIEQGQRNYKSAYPFVPRAINPFWHFGRGRGCGRDEGVKSDTSF